MPRKTEQIIQSALDAVPKEHLRGLNRVVIVDRISPDPRLPISPGTELPGLYHPRIGNEKPWFEIARQALLPSQTFFKRVAGRLNYKTNLVGLLLSLQAQHYYLTLSHGIKKHQYEGAIRNYVEKYFEIWRNQQGGLRMKLFKPLRPYLEKWARTLRKKYQQEKAPK